MEQPHHPAGSYDPAYYAQPNIYPQSSHGYYPSSSGAPPQPPHPHQPPHLPHGSSSDSSPYDSMPQSKSPPSYQTSSYTDHTHSSSFESHGGSSNGGGTGGVPPYVGFNPAAHSGDPTHFEHHHHHHPPPPHSYHHHPMSMGPPPPMHGYHPGYPWPPPPQLIEYVKDVQPVDVMSGRGGATNSHSGNRAFRALVKQFQPRYLKAKKRDKPDVAVEVVNVIRNKGGRFLRKGDFPGPQGEVLYYDIGHSKAVEKACQALREGAPVLRSKKRRGDKDTTATTSSDDEGRCTSSGESLEQDQHEGSLAASTFDQPEQEENKENSSENTTSANKQSENSSGAYEGPGEPEKKQTGPLVIQPCARFLQRDVQPISLDELPTEDRETYLQEFLPPDPSLQANSEEQQPSASLPSQIVSV